MRVGALLAFALALACSPPALVERAREPPAPAPLSSVGVAASTETPPADEPVAQAAVRLEPVLSGEAREELDWAVAAIREGLLVVPAEAPGRAQLVGPDRVVKPLPDLFKGLRFKGGDWDVDDFRVSRLEGSLDRLSFSIDVPSSGFMSHVEGRAGHFVIKPQTAEALYEEALVALPVKTPRGATLYQVLVGKGADPAFGQALRGARFAFAGPPRGERLPEPMAGDHGCKTKLLGHPFLAYLTDGALLAVGNLCTSGDDRIPVISVRGSGLYASGAAMLGDGALAAELFRNGASSVTQLPGAAAATPRSDVELQVLPEGRALLVTRTITDQGLRPYVAHFDGVSWTNVTPPELGATELGLASAYLSPTGATYLFSEGNVFRRSATLPFTKLVFEVPAASAKSFLFARQIGEWRGGALLFGTRSCAFVVRPDETFARPLELGAEEIVSAVPFGDDLYLTLRDAEHGPRLVRAVLR